MLPAMLLNSAKIGLGTAVGKGIEGSVGKLFGGGDDEEELKDMRTKEQKAAAAALQQLATTGSYNGINLGEAYTGSLGSYDTSGIEKAYQQLQDLYGGSELSTAGNTLTKLTDLTFNPDDPSSGYAAFSRALAKSGKESEDVLNREAAITGGRYGTAISGEKANLAADLANQRGQYLYQLYQNQRNTALNAANSLTNIAGAKSDIVNSASAQAQAINAIKDQQATDMYNEYKRQRSETLRRIDLLSTEANRNPYLGTDTIGTSQSPFSSLANSALSSFGKSAGSSVSSWISGLFKGGTSSSSASTISKQLSSGLYSPSVFGKKREQ